MAYPFLGEMRIMAFGFPPKGWAACNGHLLQINQNQALFSLLGTQYGGDGRVTFGLPNLQGAVPQHTGQLPQGAFGGEETHTVTLAEMPLHPHALMANAGQPAQQGQNPSPTRRLAASSPGNLWGPPTNLQPMLPQAVGSAGGSYPHENMAPFLVLNVCIALIGIFPSRP